MFKDWLRQTASYERYTGLDAYGDPSFAGATTVPCRLEREVRLVRQQDGEIFESSHTYFLDFEPVEGSKIDGRVIRGIEDNPELSGRTVVWEAYC